MDWVRTASITICFLVASPGAVWAETPQEVEPEESAEARSERLKKRLVRARTAADAGDTELASRLYESVLREKRKLAWLHLEYGEFLLAHGMLSEARKHLEYAAKRDPLNIRALMGAARCRDAAGDSEMARKLYQRVLMTEPEHSLARFHVGRLQYEAGELVEAEATYRDLVARHPEHWMGLNNLGMILVERDQPAAASGPLKAALKRRPGDPGVLYNLGRMHMASDRFDEALSYFDRAIRKSGSRDLATLRIHFDRARTLSRLDRVSPAIKAYRRCLAFDPEYAPAHLNLGSLLAQTGRYDEALEHLALAVDYQSERVEIYQVMAERALGDRDPDGALRVLELARGLDHKDGQTWILLSRALGQKGDSEGQATAMVQACTLGIPAACPVEPAPE
jgi:tetratricopeptide (TPR) repeat protein